MEELDDLYLCDGDTKHDMWVNIGNYENTGTRDVFDEPYIGNFMDTLNDRD